MVVHMGFVVAINSIVNSLTPMSGTPVTHCQAQMWTITYGQ